MFVHGCFWHRHPGCMKATTPKTREDFWLSKFERNLCRDCENQEALRAQGWKVEVVWECETRSLGILADRLKQIFRSDHGAARR